MRLKSPAPGLFTQPFVQAQIQINFNVPCYWPLWPTTIHRSWIQFSLSVDLYKIRHYIGAIMSMIASQIASLTIVYSTAYSGADQREHQSSRYWPLCGEFTGTGEFPAQRASNAENVSIWWRHHDTVNFYRLLFIYVVFVMWFCCIGSLYFNICQVFYIVAVYVFIL